MVVDEGCILNLGEASISLSVCLLTRHSRWVRVDRSFESQPFFHVG
jgi:hypothetical protein